VSKLKVNPMSPLHGSTQIGLVFIYVHNFVPALALFVERQQAE
jgi:hypothetical protein